ncbi:MAG: SIMPL domain-containing protein [Crocinitomicaceae bacterium]
MYKYFTFLFALLFVAQFTSAQDKSIYATPFIEVNGFAEKEIIPDEIYLAITIRERESGKDKVSIEKQQEDLRKALNSLNIPLENLTISDAQADYIRVKLKRNEVISQSEFQLKLKNAKEVADVIEKLDEIKINDVHISRVTHSKIKEFNKELEIEAIKAAKEKAIYLTAAIDQKIGGALTINETFDGRGYQQFDEIQIQSYKRNVAASYESSVDKLTDSITFQKIKLYKTMKVTFEIK